MKDNVDNCCSFSVLENFAVDKLLKKNCDLVFKDVSYFVIARVSLELTKVNMRLSTCGLILYLKCCPLQSLQFNSLIK